MYCVRAPVFQLGRFRVYVRRRPAQTKAPAGAEHAERVKWTPRKTQFADTATDLAPKTVTSLEEEKASLIYNLAACVALQTFCFARVSLSAIGPTARCNSWRRRRRNQFGRRRRNSSAACHTASANNNGLCLSAAASVWTAPAPPSPKPRRKPKPKTE